MSDAVRATLDAYPSLTSPAPAEAGARPTVAPWHANWGARLLLAWVVWVWIQTGWAVHTAYHIEGAILYTKYLVLFCTIYALLKDERGLRMFGWIHVGGCVLWGWTAYSMDVYGRLEIVLGPGVDDSNILGFHLVTGLAFAGLMFLLVRGVQRIPLLLGIPFILNAIILTASRSASLALVAAGAAALLLGPRVQRKALVGCSVLGLVLFAMLAQTEVFWERAASLAPADEEAEIDHSAASRMHIVRANWQMFLDYPLGAGHRGNEVLSPEYLPREWLTVGAGGEVRSAHNTFMAVLVDHGAPGALLFVLMHLWAFSRLWALRSLDRRGLPPALGTFRAAVGASLMAYFVSGQFINLLKAEVALWMLALLVVVDMQAARFLQEQRETPEGSVAAA